jgi:DNA-binding transcriptional MerR regulator
MKRKISDISKMSGVPASTIRYYVREGLLPEPERVNKKMAYYDEVCVERLQAIQYLKETRYFPLFLIKNILRRMDEGLSLPEAESVEDAVFCAGDRVGKGLAERTAALEVMGLSEEELAQAERIGLVIPLVAEDGQARYDEDDIRIGRDSLRRLMDLGLDLDDLAFFVELGQKIVEREMDLRRKIVAGRSIKENIAITAEISRSGDFFREYILRRLFQRQVQENIRKSLGREKRGGSH